MVLTITKIMLIAKIMTRKNDLIRNFITVINNRNFNDNNNHQAKKGKKTNKQTKKQKTLKNLILIVSKNKKFEETTLSNIQRKHHVHEDQKENMFLICAHQRNFFCLEDLSVSSWSIIVISQSQIPLWSP